jgi:signal transduction histidine kinase/ligand-binding sensor domain-containing protein/DNA-binding NarL/FixJ family response regulator
MRNCVSAFIIILLYPFIAGYSQQLSFEFISTEKNINAPIVRSILQDKEGYIWFGSVNDLYRYDGFNLKAFLYDPESKETITQGFVNFITQDNNDNIWIGTSSGLSKLNPHTGKIRQYILDSSAQHIFRNWVWSVFEDSRGVLWAGSMGLYRINRELDKLEPYSFSNFPILNNFSFQSIQEDKEGNLWLGTSMGLFKFDPLNEILTPEHIDPDAAGLFTKNWNTGDYSTPVIFRDKDDVIWAGTFGGKLLKINTSKNEITSYIIKDEVTSELCPVYSIVSEDENTFWLGTYNGLILFDKVSGKIAAHYKHDETLKNSLPDNKISYLMKDRSGTLWIGSLNRGIFKANRTKFLFNSISRKSWGMDKLYNIVFYPDFLISRKGTLIVGTDNGIEELTPDFKEIKKILPGKSINTLMEDSKGILWIGLRQFSGGGLLKRTEDGRIVSIIDSTGNQFKKEIHYIYEASDGKIYFGAEFLLYEVNPLNHSCRKVFETKAKIASISEDNEKNLLICTYWSGLYVFDPVGRKVIKNFIPHDLSSATDNSFLYSYSDKAGRIWVSTGEGLNLYNPLNGTFKTYDEKYGLTHKFIRYIIEDRSGKLWLGTSNGISSFDPEKETFKSYDQSYGTADGINYSAGILNGNLYFRGVMGITFFDPEKVTDNPFIPPVKITEVNIFDKSYPVRDELILSHSENYISFEFAALSYISNERNQYAYKMEGVDKEWVHSGRRRYAAYTDLRPGKYIFRVKGSNNDGVWNEEGTFLNITILPPWYQTYWAYGAYILIFLLLVYSWRKYDLKRQNLKYQLEIERHIAEKQHEVSQMKSRFFTNISHEFRTPLTLIIGPAEKVISSTGEPETQKQVSLIKKNALRLLSLINQLLDISKSDEGKLQLQVSRGNLVHFVKGIVMVFESFAEEKDIQLSVRSEKEEMEIYFDREKLEKILSNLVSNACKFTSRRGKVTVTITDAGNSAVISVKDTGIGISEKEITKLFDRFYQADSSHTREFGGTGIGLALTKELVELHKGTISASSKEGEWTEFLVKIPSGTGSYSTEEILESEPADDNLLNFSEQIHAELEAANYVPEYSSKLHNSTEGEEKNIVLIVEDNADVRDYIKDALGSDFLYEEASNGEQGLRKALEVIPDLIICDIMMPKMDGYQLTRILKTDERTNHIPVIILTAKSAAGNKLEGLETGADDYLIKPFDLNELKIRIHNLIKIRETLQEKYSGTNRKKEIPGNTKLSDANEKFMSKIRDVILSHIADEDFTIEDFGNEIGLGRVQFHRKIKAITGKSASRYLRSYRLSAAKQMIREQKGNISEISYAVGFSSPIYFSKCFKEEFGITPSELRTPPAAGE